MRRGNLNQSKAGSALKPGNYLDRLGLYVQVSNGAEDVTNRSWLFRFTSPETHRERSMGLGPIDKVSLAQAREAAAILVRQGLDPIAEKSRARASAPRAAQSSCVALRA